MKLSYYFLTVHELNIKAWMEVNEAWRHIPPLTFAHRRNKLFSSFIQRFIFPIAWWANFFFASKVFQYWLLAIKRIAYFVIKTWWKQMSETKLIKIWLINLVHENVGEKNMVTSSVSSAFTSSKKKCFCVAVLQYFTRSIHHKLVALKYSQIFFTCWRRWYLSHINIHHHLITLL